ncbi:MCP four helix bundle domain-containing protein [Rufibacter roseus]|uniref:MCP four helix bundle domain-containing protein n=2 Tax=Rufibacter roseus TaxID=1567108 RepID=A0ABW2DJ34_9BACT|nr:MCP four helix bundle domain-containing protein [Rufibacter roseus]
MFALVAETLITLKSNGMKWAYSLRRKTKVAVLLALVMVLVLAKNLIDSKNVSQLGNSFAAVYEDRLLVESYIFQLSNHLYSKKMLVDNCSNQGDYSKLYNQLIHHNTAINALILDYGKTELTEAESVRFAAFKRNMSEISRLELSYLQNEAVEVEMAHGKQLMDAQYSVAAGNLEQLSKIQVAEGKRLNEKSKEIIAGSTILTQFELVLIICLGLVIQILIFASKSVLPKFPQKPMLN